VYPVEALPTLISLDATAGLVARSAVASWSTGSGLASSISVLGASNTSPIVITVPANSLTVSDDTVGVKTSRAYHIVISGVEGNTAANNLDSTTERNEAWHAVVLTPTTLALYTINPSTGALVASTGNGAYTSGGTIKRAFVDGKILLGREYIGASSAAPRVVFVPVRSTFSAPNPASPWTTVAIAAEETEREDLGRALQTETIFYEVHVWGQEGSTTAASFTATQRMYHQIIRSAHLRCAGVYELGGAGQWVDQDEGAPQRMKLGHEFVFMLGIQAPVVDDPYEYAPDDTTIDATILLQVGENEPEPIEEE
jgi:hypothetical protein